jgi:putative transposase
MLNEDYLKERGRFFHSRKKIIYSGGVYHVIQRAPGREYLFLEDSDYKGFLFHLKNYARKFNLIIFCYALLENHFHLLLKITKPNLNQAMQSFLTKYAKIFNKKYERKGHVFSGNYVAPLVLSDSYLLASSLYIHLNPYKAGLTKDIFNYKWSSASFYTQYNKHKRGFIEDEFILKMLNDDINRAIDIYKRLLIESAKIKFKNIFEDQNIISKLKGKILSFLRRTEKKNINSSYILEELDIEEKIKDLNKRYLSKPYEKKARAYLIQQLYMRGYSYKEIAEKLNISRRSIFYYLKLLH